jgi:S-adenosylhomocysteine hydrolase
MLEKFIRKSPGFFLKSTRPLFFHSPARHNLVPKLPLLDEIDKTARKNGLADQSRTVLIGVQHMLPTTATLFDTLIDGLGLKPSNMFFTGKFYSSYPPIEQYIRNRGVHLMPTRAPKRPGEFEEQMEETITKMWEILGLHLQTNDIEKIIILDEGGHCSLQMPKWICYKYPFASIEQTRYGFYSGFYGSQLFPLIDVARCAAKKRLESPLIASAILKRIKSMIDELNLTPQTVFGIAGNGAVGSSIANHLLSLGYTVLVYDESDTAFQNVSSNRCYRVDEFNHLLHGCDVVFGCTGRDLTKNVNLLRGVKKPVMLVSCTSQGIEFQTLLKMEKQSFKFSKTESFSYLKFFNHSGVEITVLENGYPINFDRTPQCDPPDDMALTRGLLLGAYIQAATMASKPINDGVTPNKGKTYMLDPYLQQFVVKRWQTYQPIGRFKPNELEPFDSIQWIAGNSSGDKNNYPFFKRFNESIKEANELQEAQPKFTP